MSYKTLIHFHVAEPEGEGGNTKVNENNQFILVQ